MMKIWTPFFSAIRGIQEGDTMEVPSNEAEIGPETGSNIRSRL